jgi:hypothetical protein
MSKILDLGNTVVFQQEKNLKSKYAAFWAAQK